MSRRSATLLGLSAIVLWSFSVAVARSLTESIGAITAAACVYFLGGILTGVVQVARGGGVPSPRHFSRRYLFGCGGLFVGCLVSFYVAIGLASDRLQLLEIGLVNYLWTVLTVLLSVPVLRKRAGQGLLPGVAVAAAGIVLVLTQGGGFSLPQMCRHVGANPAAYGAAFVAAVTWALYSNFCRRWGAANQEGAVALFMCVTGIVLLGLRLTVAEPSGWSVRAVLEVLFLATTSTAGYVLWDIGVRKGDFVLISTSSYFTPLFSSVVSCVYLGVLPGMRLWAGCLLIIAGAWASRTSIREGSAAGE